MSFPGVVNIIGRKLRLAVVGGGLDSFIGEIHRIASRMDNQYQLVAGVFSSDPDKSVDHGVRLGIPKDRAYRDFATLLEKESLKDDKPDVIAIMTPNNFHYEYSIAALNSGFNVICDKPLTNSLSEAIELRNKVKESGLEFCLTHNYTGYPMVRQAREMVKNNDLGIIRLIQVEYVQGGKADESVPDRKTGPRSWKFDRNFSGPSLVLGDIGSHAHNLIRYITGLEVSEVCSEVGAIVPGREVDDYAGALLRMDNGARGSFWVTQAAAGIENGLRIRICGNKGSIEWNQEQPQLLSFKPLKEPAQIRTPNGPGSYPLTKRSCRIVPGHPEGFPEAFANLYSDFAEIVASNIAGIKVDPITRNIPNAEDGLKGVAFIEAALESSNNGSRWVKLIS